MPGEELRELELASGRHHAFFRMPSCQINRSIEGSASVVATAIVDRTYVSLIAWRNKQSARSIRAVNR